MGSSVVPSGIDTRKQEPRNASTQRAASLSDSFRQTLTTHANPSGSSQKNGRRDAWFVREMREVTRAFVLRKIVFRDVNRWVNALRVDANGGKLLDVCFHESPLQ